MGIWSVHGQKDSKPPERMNETRFLPVRTSTAKDAADIQKQRDRVVEKVNDVMLSMCGY